MKQLLKRLAKLLLGEYSIYRILCRSADAECPALPLPEGFSCERVDRASIERADDAPVREQAFYFTDGAIGWACYDPSRRIVGLCVYWFGERYKQRNFWPLKDDEAKLVEVITLPEMRGRGLASCLIDHSGGEMFRLGFRRLLARVWHSNTPSLRAFANAGWFPQTTVIDIFPLGRARWRICYPVRRRPEH